MKPAGIAEKLEAAEREAAQLRGDKAGLQLQVLQLGDSIAKLSSSMQHLERGLQSQLDELNLMIEQKSEQASTIQATNHELYLQLQEHELRLSFADSVRADLESRVAEYKVLWEEGVAKAQAISTTIDGKNERLRVLEGENHNLQLRVQEFELRLTVAESARADLEVRVAEYKVLWEEGAERAHAMSTTIKAKCERVSALEGENRELQLCLQQCELRLTVAESARADLEVRVAEYDLLWEEGVERLQAMSMTIEARGERVSALEGENRELRLRVHELDHQLSSAEATSAELEAHVDQYLLLWDEGVCLLFHQKACARALRLLMETHCACVRACVWACHRVCLCVRVFARVCARARARSRLCVCA
jgi:chromosome segregation ATPase